MNQFQHKKATLISFQCTFQFFFASFKESFRIQKLITKQKNYNIIYYQYLKLIVLYFENVCIFVTSHMWSWLFFLMQFLFQKTRTVKTFHLHGWRREDFVPPQIDTIVQLIAKVEKWTRKNRPAPVIVTC